MDFKTIFLVSSLAQDESRTISENNTWGIRKRYADGHFRMSFFNFLGYKRGPNGEFVIVEKEAKIVKYIYKMYLKGMSYREIARDLTNRQIKTPGGKDKWDSAAIGRILTNEKYIGDAMSQKVFTLDFLSKKQRKNRGEVPQYYIENDHEPIISKEMFKAVQLEINKRIKKGGRYSLNDFYSRKLICGDCGGVMSRIAYKPNTEHGQIYYGCRHKKHCKIKYLKEPDIKNAFIKGLNIIISDKKRILQNLELLKEKLGDVKDLEAKKEKIEKRLQNIVKITKAQIENVATTNNASFSESYDELSNKHIMLKKEVDEIDSKIEERKNRIGQIDIYAKEFRKQNSIEEFDADLWDSLVEKMIVYNDRKIVVFKDGREVTV